MKILWSALLHRATIKMNLSTVKWAQWDKSQSKELLGLFICVRSALCTIVAHNIAQNRHDNFPSYPPDNHHCSDDVYLREGGMAHYGQTWCHPKNWKYITRLKCTENFISDMWSLRYASGHRYIQTHWLQYFAPHRSKHPMCWLLVLVTLFVAITFYISLRQFKTVNKDN